MKRPSEGWKIAKDVALLVASVLVAFLLTRFHVPEELATFPAGLPLAALVAGVLFSSAFTAAPAAVAIAQLINVAGPWEVILIGGLGSVIGNLMVYQLFRGNVSKELDHLLKKWGHKEWLAIVRDHHFRWLAVVVASVIIISPLPDELGVAFLGVSGLPLPVFAGVCYVTNALCMLALTSIGRLF